MNILDCAPYLREGYGLRRSVWAKGWYLVCSGDSLFLENPKMESIEWQPTYDDVIAKDWTAERRK